MIKTILLVLLGVFFILNGVNHFFNTDVLAEYAHKRGIPIISPKLAVYLSGVLLLFGGLSLMSGFFKLYGIIGLSIFLVMAAFMTHQFWRETNSQRMDDGGHALLQEYDHFDRIGLYCRRLKL